MLPPPLSFISGFVTRLDWLQPTCHFICVISDGDNLVSALPVTCDGASQCWRFNACQTCFFARVLLRSDQIMPNKRRGKHINQPTHSSRESHELLLQRRHRVRALWQVGGHRSTEQALCGPPSQRACFTPAKAKDTSRSVRHQLDKHSFKSHDHASQLRHIQGVSAVHSVPHRSEEGKWRNR